MVGMNEDAARIREPLEIGRIRDDLADEFDDVALEVLEQGIRNEFARRPTYPVQDFVPVSCSATSARSCAPDGSLTTRPCRR